MNIRLVSTATLYGLIAFLIFCAASAIAWRLYPYPAGADRLLHTRVWLLHSLFEKIAGVFIGCIIAFAAARAYRPSWKLGFSTGILAAVTFQASAIVLYLSRFGFQAYETYHAFIRTLLSTVVFGALFSFIAVWRQYRHELQPRA